MVELRLKRALIPNFFVPCKIFLCESLRGRRSKNSFHIKLDPNIEQTILKDFYRKDFKPQEGFTVLKTLSKIMVLKVKRIQNIY